MELIRVKDKNHLVRDTTSNGIINFDVEGYEQYTEHYKRVYNEKKAIKNLESEVSEIKTDLNEIKSLLKELLNGP